MEISMKFKYIDIQLHRMSFENSSSNFSRFDVVLYYDHSLKLPKQFWYNITHDEVQELIDRHQPTLYKETGSRVSLRFKWGYY